MPKKSNCVDCNSICFGIRCKKCNGTFKRKWEERSEAQRNHNFIKKYNIDVELFEAMWIAYRGRCDICNCNMIRPLKQRGQPLNTVCVDHDHKTGKVRGLICSKCNKALGFFEDNLDRLELAKRYLEKHNG